MTISKIMWLSKTKKQQQRYSVFKLLTFYIYFVLKEYKSLYKILAITTIK